jgi:small subunit ribosomal protein S6
MKAYECMVLVDPTFSEADIEKMIAKVEEQIQKSGNVLETTNRWGKRKLAYEIKKVNEAFYVLFNYKANTQFNVELDKTMKFTNGVMRHMIIASYVEKKKAPAKAMQAM